MSRRATRRRLLVCAVVAAAACGGGTAAALAGSHHRPPPRRPGTATPIRHLVVIFQENVSFDHYFATYPHAANPPGEPRFEPARGTPTVNGLDDSLLAPNNPNAVQPFRLGRDQAESCDQDHSYTSEQQAYDGGLMDRFVETVGRGAGTCRDYGRGKGLTMGYYDGNTVTALWNYAQRYAMSDNSYNTTFGPSTPGALNLVSGQTHGFAQTSPAVTANGTVIGDPQPAGDRCATRDTTTATRSGARNVGDLLNDRGVTWGWSRAGSATARRATPTSAARRAGTTSRTTSRSSTTPRPPTRGTSRRPRRPASAAATRPTTSTT